jgi:hypothetical protein
VATDEIRITIRIQAGTQLYDALRGLRGRPSLAREALAVYLLPRPGSPLPAQPDAPAATPSPEHRQVPADPPPVAEPEPAAPAATAPEDGVTPLDDPDFLAWAGRFDMGSLGPLPGREPRPGK